MFAILVFAIVAAMVWWLLMPSLAFVKGFATLVETPRITHIAFSFPRFKSMVSGDYKGRAVRLTLLHPARRIPGEGVAAMATSALGGEPWKDSALTHRNPEVSRATFDLEGKYGLILSLADGWLRATWRRPGLKFPGPFDEAMWRNTLVQMDSIARWMEQRQKR
jgi:hypothetical protein